jgi:peptidyl-prolyl cis-trans isomerase C
VFPRRTAFLGLIVGLALVGAPSRAESDAARRAVVAVRVGDRTLTVGELEDRFAGIPPFQQATLGATRNAVVHAYVEQVVVHDLLLTAGAEQRGLAEREPTRSLVRRALSTATLRASHAPYPSANAIPMEDVQRYYDENRARFDAPERINVWRILCKSDAEAQEVLGAAKRTPTIANYNDLARVHSLDKATNLRGGNLGFIAPDGNSNEAGLRVDPALVKSVHGLKDGEFAPRPVPEGDGFAVVWRRATVPPSKRTVEEAAAQIRSTLYRERIEAAEKKLVDDLRARKVSNVDASKLGMIVLPAFDAGVNLPRSAPSSSATPQK